MRLAQVAALPLAGLLASEAAADPVVIVAPADDAVVPPSFTVTVEFGTVEYCDTDGCTDVPADTVYLNADSAGIEDCHGCSSPANFLILLDPGPHTLQAIAGYTVPTSYSELVHVIVEEDPTTGTTGESTTSGESTDPDGTTGTTATNATTEPAPDTGVEPPPPKTDGCACEADTPTHGALWLAFACFVARRVRRRAQPPRASAPRAAARR